MDLQAQAWALWSEVPAATRCIVVANGAFSLVGLLVPVVATMLQLSVLGASHGHVFALFTYWLVSPGSGNPLITLLVMILTAWMTTVYFSPMEKEKGTVRFFCWVLVGGVFIGLLFLILTFLVAQLDPIMVLMPCGGLWPLLLLVITKRYLSEPADAAVSIWGLFQVPARWYPCALIGFFSLLSMQLQMEMVGAWIVGVAAHQAEGGTPLVQVFSKVRLHLDWFIPSMATVQNVEDQIAAGSGSILGGGSIREKVIALPLALLRRLAKLCPDPIRRQYVPAQGGLAMPAMTSSSTVGAKTIGKRTTSEMSSVSP